MGTSNDAAATNAPQNTSEARNSMVLLAGRRTRPLPSRIPSLEEVPDGAASGVRETLEADALSITAPPNAAQALVSLFDGMARLLSSLSTGNFTNDIRQL